MKEATITCFLFDWDGTLLNNTRLIMESYSLAYQRILKQRLNPELLRACLGQRTEEITQALHIPPAYQTAFINTFRAHQHQSGRKGTYLMPGTRFLLKVLKFRNCHIGLVSAKRRARVVEDLTYYNLQDFFEVIIGAEQCTRHKPDPTPILQACKALHITPSKDTVAYIGDTVYDLSLIHI